MTRDSVLRETMKTVLNEKEIDSFFSYKITRGDMNFLQEATTGVLKNIPAKAFNCALMSALLGAVIFDHSKIPVVVVSGHLDYYSRRIFNCKKPIPYSTNKKVINEIWDGHCWVEICNLIIDISIFRTIYYGQVPQDLHKEIIENFGEGKGTIAGTQSELKKSGFIYSPCYCLTQDQINGLINKEL